MEILHSVVAVVTLTISGLGAVVVIWGVMEAIIAFFGLKFSSMKEDAVPKSETIRQRLGAHLLLGLEIFIAEISSVQWLALGKSRHPCINCRR